MKHARHLYQLRVTPETGISRDTLIPGLHEQRIGTGVRTAASIYILTTETATRSWGISTRRDGDLRHDDQSPSEPEGNRR